MKNNSVTRVVASRAGAMPLLLVMVALGCGGSRQHTAQAPTASLGPLEAFEASRPRCVAGPVVVADRATRDAVHVIAERIRATGNLPADTPAEALNEGLDRNYRELLALGAPGRVAARAEVIAEVSASAPNDFLLLDLGHFLMSDDCAELEVARAALERLDPTDPIVRMGNTDLFEFTHAMAFRYGPGLLPVVDRVAAAADRSVFYPQHYLELNPLSQAILLWGVTDPRVDRHLAELIQQEGPARRRAAFALGILSTPDNAPALATLTGPTVDSDLRVNALRGLINGAGDQGRQVILQLVPAEYQPGEQAGIEHVQRLVQGLSYASLRAHVGDGEHLNAIEARRRLAAAVANAGVDDELQPGSVLDAELSRPELIDWLCALRAAQLRRISDEGMADAQISSALISAVAYREH